MIIFIRYRRTYKYHIDVLVKLFSCLLHIHNILWSNQMRIIYYVNCRNRIFIFITLVLYNRFAECRLRRHARLIQHFTLFGTPYSPTSESPRPIKPPWPSPYPNPTTLLTPNRLPMNPSIAYRRFPKKLYIKMWHKMWQTHTFFIYNCKIYKTFWWKMCRCCLSCVFLLLWFNGKLFKRRLRFKKIVDFKVPCCKQNNSWVLDFSHKKQTHKLNPIKMKYSKIIVF